LERRLAAILAADVAGYTALMGDDETGTLRRLTDLRREVLEPLIDEHRGRVVKLMGDGLLVEFASVVDAVACALAWQGGVNESEATTAENKRLQFRIGINLGDVIVQGDDIHGDGVNIAARLENLARPGDICLSGDTYRQVRGKIDVEFDNLGEQEVKNVKEPVQVYRISAPVSIAGSSSQKTEPLALPDKPSIAVLPFTNMTGDPEQEYFSDGVTAEITTQLARFRDLFVISQNSAFLYKNSAASSQKAGQDLGVAYILEGSIQKAGNRVRIAAKLLDAATSVQLWAERYDRELSDIFAVQDEVTARIVSALAGQIEESGRKRAAQKSTENLAAYDCFLRGEHYLAQGSMADILEARKMFERAIELDPHHAQSWAGLALSYMEEHWSNWTSSPEAAAERSFELAQKAVAVDERESRAHLALGEAYLYARRDFDRALIEIEKASDLNPNDYTNYCIKSWLLALDGRTTEGIACASTAFRLNPYAAYDCRIGQFLAFFAAAAYEDALTALQNISSPEGIAQACLAACYAKLGRTAEANKNMAAFIEKARSEIRIFPGENPVAWREYWAKFFPFRATSVFDDLMEGMRDAGLPT
jgi:TolB-like protein/Flp pilus assembly protein TadD